MEAAAQAAQFDLNVVPEGAVAVGADHLDGAFVQPIDPVQRRGRDGKFIYGDPDFKGVDASIVEFYRNPVKNADYVKITYPGDKFFGPDRPVTEEDKQRYARQWNLFVSQEDQLKGQTRLTRIAWLDPAARNRLAEARILTVEQLASVTDTNLQRLGPGMRTFVQRAKQHLGEKAQYQKAHEVHKEVEDLRKENAEMKAQMEKLMKTVEASQAAPAKRGRPAKAEKEAENAG